MENMEITLAQDSQYGKAGDRVTLALQPQDVRDPTEMSQYLAGYKPFGYRADQVSVPVMVNNDSDKFRTFSSDNAFKKVEVKGSTQSAVNEVDPKSSLDTYKVVERFIGAFIPAQTEMQDSNNYRPRFAALRRCANAISLDREIDVFDLINTAGNWATAQQNTAIDAWTEESLGAPLTDLQDSIVASAQPVTGIWMCQEASFAFFRHPQVINSMRQSLGDSKADAVIDGVFAAQNTDSDVRIPGLPPIHISAAKVLNETSGNLDYVFNRTVCNLITQTPGVPADGEDVATTWTFRRRGDAGNGFDVREYFIESRGPKGGTMVVAAMADVAKMTANNAGGIITGILD